MMTNTKVAMFNGDNIIPLEWNVKAFCDGRDILSVSHSCAAMPQGALPQNPKYPSDFWYTVLVWYKEIEKE